MRRLQSRDLFACARLIKRFGLKEEIEKISLNAKDQRKAGFDLLYTVFEKASEEGTEKDIYKFLAPIFEISEEEIETMEIEELFGHLAEVSENAKWRDFFSQALRAAGVRN